MKRGDAERMVVGFTWELIVGAIAMALLAGILMILPFISSWLEARGLPASAVVGAILVAMVVVAALILRTLLPSSARSREVAALGRSLGFRFRRRFRLPASLPMVVDGLSEDSLGVSNLLVGEIDAGHGDRRYLVFDLQRTPPGYGPATWETVVATRTALDAPVLRLRVRSHRDGLGDGFEEVQSESGAFNRRFRVSTEDPRFASALLDSRMLAWLLRDPEQGGPVGLDEATVELAGSWIRCVTPQADLSRVRRSLELLDGMLPMLPRVATRMFPAPDPGLPGR
jgi:hypothetical protein